MGLKLKTYLDDVQRCDAEPRNESGYPASQDDLFLAALRECKQQILRGSSGFTSSLRRSEPFDMHQTQAPGCGRVAVPAMSLETVYAMGSRTNANTLTRVTSSALLGWRQTPPNHRDS